MRLASLALSFIDPLLMQHQQMEFLSYIPFNIRFLLLRCTGLHTQRILLARTCSVR